MLSKIIIILLLSIVASRQVALAENFATTISATTINIPAGKEPTANVFENDSRTPADFNAPWKGLGKLISPDGSYCSATLVSKDLILTAAHCVIKNKKFVKGTYRFYPRYKNGSKEYSGVDYIWWGTTDPETYRAQDWALLRLSKELGNTYGWRGVRKTSVADLAGTFLYGMAAYSSDYQAGEVASQHLGCAFTGSSGGLLLHNCNTSRGSSGAAMFNVDNWNDIAGSSHVIAIHVAEYRGDAEQSFSRIPYSDELANIAIPTEGFFDLIWKEYR